MFCNALRRKGSLVGSGLQVGTPRCRAVAGVTLCYSVAGKEAWPGQVMAQNSMWLHCASQDLQSLLQYLTLNLPEACFKPSSATGLRQALKAARSHVWCRTGCCHPALMLRVAPRPQHHCERPASAATVHSPAPYWELIFSTLSGCNLGAGGVQAHPAARFCGGGRKAGTVTPSMPQMSDSWQSSLHRFSWPCCNGQDQRGERDVSAEISWM